MATRAKRRREKRQPEINDAGYVIDEEEIDYNTSDSSFDVNKYTVGGSTHEVTLLVGSDEDELTLTVRNMPWSKRNRIISKCLTWDGTGNTNFDGDAYVRQCLKEIIVEAPWGVTSEAFLVRIDSDLGTALESLVPNAFDTDTMDKGVDDLKKGL